MANFRPQIDAFNLRGLRDFKPLHEIDTDIFIEGVNLNSNEIVSGDLFVALSGDNTHGANFAQSAQQNGAKAILTDAVGAGLLAQFSELPVIAIADLRQKLGEISSKIYGEPSKKLKIFGITGTNGKTTTSWILHSGLNQAGISTAILGTAGNKIGNLEISATRTTPEAPQLQAMLAYALEKNHSAVVMEVSSHALEMNRVSGTWFEAVGFTNLSQDHLDFHGTMENYFKAKQKLFTTQYSNFASICMQDEWGQRLAKESEIPFTTIGTADGLDWKLKDVNSASGHVDFKLNTPENTQYKVKLEIAGAFNAFNATLAIAMSSRITQNRKEFLTGVERSQIPGRMQPVLVPGCALGIIDYAHTPEAISEVIKTLKAQTEGRVIAVLGAGGNRDKSKRAPMGTAVANADLVIITDDNPRDEDPAEIRQQVIRGITRGKEYLEIADRNEAIEFAVKSSTAKDTIVVLGKGHEDFQEIKGKTIAFSDLAALNTALMAGLNS